MKKLLVIAVAALVSIGLAQAPKSKVPEQGFVPEGWYPHEGGLLKYEVNIRFGEEPSTMPAGWRFGRVSAVAANQAATEILVFQRNSEIDPLIVLDNKGK